MPKTERDRMQQAEDSIDRGSTERSRSGELRTHAERARSKGNFPKYSIAVAADLSGLPPQQLRRMEESGLVAPTRTAGKTRRYSDNDLAQIAQIADLTEAGINAEGVRRVLLLEQELRDLRAELADVRDRLRVLEQEQPRNRGDQ